MVPGSLKSVKAIGWFIKEYGVAQISMNLTNLSVTPLHIAFDEVCRKAEARGMRVTGSELVGLIPLQSLLSAGKYFLKKQNRSTGVSEKELIRIAIISMGLDELAPFKPEERIIEYLLKEPEDEKLIRLSLSDFADETASESPAPGGGSVAAYLGALGAGLAAMVANLSAQKKDWESFSDWQKKLPVIKRTISWLCRYKIQLSYGEACPKRPLWKRNPERLCSQLLNAIEVPYRVMQVALKSMDVLTAMATAGNPNSKSDAGVGALCARSAVMGAYLNISINATGSETDEKISEIIEEGRKMLKTAERMEKDILGIIGLTPKA